MQEVWKKLKGFENYFLISSNGRLIARKRTIVCGQNKKQTKQLKARFLKPFKMNTGYYAVELCVNGKNTRKLLHRLIAENFITNPENKTIINHIDNKKHNNSLENLEWCTQKENVFHAIKIGATKWEYLKKLTKKQINKIKKMYNKKTFNQAMIADLFKIDQATVSRIINHKNYKQVSNG